MLVFGFDTELRIAEIENHLSKVSEIKSSLADNRDKYRDFSKGMCIEQNSLFMCCDTFERSLLINCYTFSEQLTKNIIYELLQKDKHCNPYINNFINTTMASDTFSPRVKVKEIEDNIKRINKTFKFILPATLHEFEVYNEMVKSRHKYAHRGIYDFDFTNFDDVIKTLYYINFELSSLAKNDLSRNCIQEGLEELKKLTKKINNKEDIKDNLIYKKILLKKIRDISKSIYMNYSNNIQNIRLLDELFDIINQMRILDLRGVNKAILTVDKFNRYYSIC